MNKLFMRLRVVSPRTPRSMRVLTLSATLFLSAPSLFAQTPPPTTPATASATAAAAPAVAVRAPRESWSSDRRSFVVGDIITVLIDDYTISTAVKENTASDTRSRGLAVTANLPGGSKGGGLDSRNNADQQQRGSARRENRFQNEMSVRVVAVGANGLLQLKGHKKIDVDKAAQDIVFTGWVRAQDVSTQNMVESNRVADALLAYTSPGPLGTPKQGIVSKVLGALWP